MNNQAANEQEQSLVKLYVELTGTTESCARGVFMYLSQDSEAAIEPTGISLRENP